MNGRQAWNATAYGLNHAEAFCLMKYRSADGAVEEWIFNTRDGVTPMFVYSRDGRELTHVEWNRDRFMPQHVPQVGDRVFVDLTEEIAAEKARELVRDHWLSGRWPHRMMDTFESKAMAVEQIAAGWMSDKGQPTVVEVDDRLRDELRREAARRPKLPILGSAIHRQT